MKQSRNLKVATDRSLITEAIPKACADETAAVEFLERQRWGDFPECPRCASREVFKLMDRNTGQRNRRFLWSCKGCRRQFTVRIGTVFEDSRIPLRHWCYGYWAACASKKGVSALQIKRMTGLSYQSALFMMHRIRWAMADVQRPVGKLGEGGGTVEADETYVGGKPRYKGIVSVKAPVFAMVERGGKVRARHIDRVNAKTLRSALMSNVDPSARLITDELGPYRKVGKPFKGGHRRIMHKYGRYVRGDVYTNTVESWNAIFKRGLIGTYHSVSKQHLHRYVAEFEFRWNTRRIEDGYRVGVAIRRSQGKRLRYRGPLAK